MQCMPTARCDQPRFHCKAGVQSSGRKLSWRRYKGRATGKQARDGDRQQCMSWGVWAIRRAVSLAAQGHRSRSSRSHEDGARLGDLVRHGGDAYRTHLRGSDRRVETSR
jgi:hypothetical protein